jgi:SAM-dependent methyltransferase
LFADRGCQVTAVEPNIEMMRSAAAHPGVTWVCAPAESTGLRSAGTDLVLCAQSFHWFRATEALDEFARVLRPGGRLALIWNIRDERDPFSREYGELMIETATDASVGKDFQLDALTAHPRFSSIEQLQVDGIPQQLDYEGLLGRATSSSYAPKSGPGFERLASGLKHAVERACDERGFVQLRYVTQVFISHSR